MGDTFDFSQALRLLHAGHRLKRTTCRQPWSAIFIDEIFLVTPTIREKGLDGVCRLWCPTQLDILAKDWMVADDDE